MKQNLKIERAISELKRGYNIVLSDPISSINVLLSSAEMTNDSTISNHIKIANSSPNLILSKNRCKALNFQTNNNCSILLDLNWSKENILEIVLSKSLRKDFKIDGLLEENSEIIKSCLKLLKLSKLVPAGIMTLISVPNIRKMDEWCFKNNLILIDINDVSSGHEFNNKDIEILTKTHLPIKQTKDCDIVVFRSIDGFDEYFCLLIGDSRNILEKKQINPPLVRIHSQCLTGDVLNSLKCDCGEQLDSSINLMVKNNNGILIYLSQEGRNIGLTNKLRAYKLQEEGLDTIDANLALGFEEDERNYDIACMILKKFKVKQVMLLSNNPDKCKELERKGIQIIKRISLKTKNNEFNKNYLKTKKNKSGHYL